MGDASFIIGVVVFIFACIAGIKLLGLMGDGAKAANTAAQKFKYEKQRDAQLQELRSELKEYRSLRAKALADNNLKGVENLDKEIEVLEEKVEAIKKKFNSLINSAG